LFIIGIANDTGAGDLLNEDDTVFLQNLGILIVVQQRVRLNLASGFGQVVWQASTYMTMLGLFSVPFTAAYVGDLDRISSDWKENTPSPLSATFS
jgi:hypothetical protein